MAQTALQELKTMVKENSIRIHGQYFIDTECMYKLIESLLPKERQIIEDAYNQGIIESDKYPPIMYPSDYFTQNFNQ